MSEPVTVRLASVADAEAMAAIQNAVNADLALREGRPNTARIRTAGPIGEGILKRGTDPLENAYVACQGERVVGHLYVSTTGAEFWPNQVWSQPDARTLCVFGLCVHPAEQNKGYGRALMNQVEIVAADHQIPLVRLDTYPHRTQAYEFYKRLAYEERTQIDLNGTPLALFEKRVI